MRRPLVVAVCVIAGASIGVLIARLLKSRKYTAPYTRNFSSKYTDIIKREGNGNVEHSDETARIMVIYGSSSGNAEGYAKNLVSDLKERGADVSLIDPSSWSHLSQFNSNQPLFPMNAKGEPPIVIFIVATTGEGEVPANFYCLFAEMRSALQKGGTEGKMVFSNVSYAVFALGDSSYKYFCRGGLDVNMFLKRGGGKELLPVVIGDARNPLQEEVFEEWEEKLMGVLEERCGIVLTAGSDAPPKPQLIFQFTPEKTVSPLPYIPPPSLLEPSMQNPVQLVVKGKNSRTVQRDDDGSFILHLVLSSEDHMITYQAGDHLGIYPANLPDIIEAYRIVLNISEKEWMTPVELCTTANARSRASLRNTFPARVTLQKVFEYYLDLSGKPRKSMLRVLAKYCSDPNEKKLFMEILNRDNQKNKKQNSKEMDSSTLELSSTYLFRTLLDYLKKFPSCCSIPIGHFLEMMPRVQPRYYSIASDMMTHPKTIEAFIRIVPDGMNSKYLQSISVGEKITAFIHKSTFHLPAKCGERPVVMIGPGTGVASMIGFCYRRAALMKKQPNAAFGPMVLFFGAQRRESEYFVREELEGWCPQGEGKLPDAEVFPPPVLTLLDLAFSRDQCEKYYVTDLIEKHKDYLFKLLTSNANGGCLLYVSGNASEMAKSVDQALVNLLVYGGMTRTAASKFLQNMENEHKFMKDVY
ncbi:NADPH cytochrome P450 reductase B [Trypanosoma theileri]|uniref:NADPH cytochrome P450 reductase B n=1 Tax=Trypanosoma theileri TaxID=67003 RepID=A0A1X0P5U2_9TRYP|nr:NADPH cytochrome P450 reductase B [Trypanosoma theileri]ORC92218.1 NADPH cytochrome P450 reductase B [Trypanosoma theileri]